MEPSPAGAARRSTEPARTTPDGQALRLTALVPTGPATLPARTRAASWAQRPGTPRER